MQVIDELNLLLGIGPSRARLPASLERNYQAVRPIGKGGFGQAHLLFCKKDQKYYVAKQINTSAMTNKQRKEAHHEIDMLQKLEHPHIVRYVEYAEDRANLFIVMEYADGGDLASYLTKAKAAGKLLSEPEIMRLFTQTALALKHMHDRRMLHRDIKAQNVFLTKSNDVKMGDFGISTVLKSTMAMAQTVCGTPYYFSPELCTGQPYNNKSDIWALGVLLYNLCTGGDFPFDATSMKGLTDAIMKKQPAALPKQYSSALNELVMSLLAKDSKRRPNIDAVLRSPAVMAVCAPLVEAALQPKPLPEGGDGVDGLPTQHDRSLTPTPPPAGAGDGNRRPSGGACPLPRVPVRQPSPGASPSHARSPAERGLHMAYNNGGMEPRVPHHNNNDNGGAMDVTKEGRSDGAQKSPAVVHLPQLGRGHHNNNIVNANGEDDASNHRNSPQHWQPKYPHPEPLAHHRQLYENNNRQHGDNHQIDEAHDDQHQQVSPHPHHVRAAARRAAALEHANVLAAADG